MSTSAGPYTETRTEEEQQTVYQQLLAQYEKTERKRKEKIRKDWAEDWNQYREIQLRENKAFYQHVAMFAAGSFGISFAFINNLVTFETAEYKNVLVLGWALFALVLIIDAAIHLTSGFIHGAYCDIISENIQCGYEGKPYKSFDRWYSGWVMTTLYVLNFVTFIGGIICLVMFVYLNT
jgi:hypothetical protein